MTKTEHPYMLYLDGKMWTPQQLREYKENKLKQKEEKK